MILYNRLVVCTAHTGQKEFNEITVIHFKRLLYMTTIITMVLSLCTGCSSERKEAQLAYREQGIAYLESGEYDKAVEAFQSALDEALGEIDEVALDICYYKAQAQYMSGDDEGALSTYTAIIAYNQDPKAYYQRGNLYYRMHDSVLALSSDVSADSEYDKKAIADYKQAVKYEKQDYELYIGIYDALADHKNADAESYLKIALDIKGDSAYDKLQKGRIRFLLGAYEDAISLLNAAADGGEYEAYYYLAETYLVNGNDAEGSKYMKAYIASQIADSYRLYSIAENQIVREKYDIAIDCLEAALKLEKVPNRQSIMKTLVVVYEHNEDFASARNVLSSYVQSYPEDEEAARELIFLETR